MKINHHGILRTVAIAAIIALTAVTAAARSLIIVVDAGHGGNDTGAPGKVTVEKNITLPVALKVGDMLKKEVKGVKVVYTRKTDTTLNPYQRASKANDADADLFISIHNDAVDGSTSPCGSSVLIPGTKLYLTEDEAKDKKKIAEADDFIAQSRALATIIQSHLVADASRSDRGVKVRNDLPVLTLTRMPAVLVELDFITNPEQERYLMSDEGQTALATAIVNAVKEYVKSHDKKKTKDGKKGSNGRGEKVAAGTPAKKAKDKGKTDKGSRSATTAAAPTAASGSNSTTAHSTFTPDDVVYKVQFLTSDRQLPPDSPRFKKLTPVEWYKDGTTYKYTFGATLSLDDAKALMKKVRKLFPDAFIIITRNGERIK